MCDLASSPVVHDEIGKLVSDYWEHGQGGKWDLLSPILSAEVLDKIRSISVLPQDTNEDRLVWRHTSDGRLTVKAVCYR